MKKMKYLLLIMVWAMFSCNDENKSGDNTTVPSTNDSGSNVAGTKDNSSNNAAIDTNLKNSPQNAQDKNNAAKNKRKGMVTINVSPNTTPVSMDKQGYYTNADVLPSYPGGQNSLSDFFNNNIEYPQQAIDNGTQGTVNISFLVDENGKISSPKVENKAIGDGLEEEALRVFSKMPAWTAGKVKGKNVKSRFTLPVRFELTD